MELILGRTDEAHALTAVAVVPIVRVEAAVAEAHEVRVVTIVRRGGPVVARGGPVVAVGSDVPDRSPIPPTSGRQEHRTSGRERTVPNGRADAVT